MYTASLTPSFIIRAQIFHILLIAAQALTTRDYQDYRLELEAVRSPYLGSAESPLVRPRSTNTHLS